MDCVITAGGQLPADDPLLAYTGGESKALLDIGGRTMLERIVDALQGSQFIGEIVVVGIGEDSGLQFGRPVHYVPEQGSLVANVLAGVHWFRMNRPQSKELLISTADIPSLTSAIVDDLILSCSPFDRAVYYTVVTRQAMEARFPGSRRTFVTLRDGQFAGGDIVVVQADVADMRDDWSLLTDARKHAWKLARLVGLRTLLKFALRRLSLKDVEEIGSEMLGRPVKILISPHPELAMDVDKPDQADLLRAEFAVG